MSVTRRSFLELVAAVGGVVCTGMGSSLAPISLPSPEPTHGDEGVDIAPELAEELSIPPQLRPTKLETFLKSRGIKPAHLARESGYSRQHLLRIRMGYMEPTRQCIIAIVLALRILSGEDVHTSDVFDLGGAA